MHFTSGINRPPFEANSGFLQVTSGCSHKKCAFCGYFKSTKFEHSPLEEIEADVKEIPEYFGEPTRIFLQSADAFLSTKALKICAKPALIIPTLAWSPATTKF